MQGWSLADDNEVKETNNLSPVGFSNINNKVLVAGEGLHVCIRVCQGYCS